jgi:hypothetical protein
MTQTSNSVSKASRILPIVGLALIGWALCFTTIGIGMATTTQNNALVIHAVAAPIYFVGLSLIYFRRFNYTPPLETALAFVGIVIAMDFFVAAMLILRSFVMFYSPLGTWIPFGLIFASTWLTGLFVDRSSRKLGHAEPTAPSA